MTFPSVLLAAGRDVGLSTVAVVLIVVVSVALLALFLAALVSILRSPVLTSTGKVVWVVVVLLLQFFGPVAWFLFGRNASAATMYREDPPGGSR